MEQLPLMALPQSAPSGGRRPPGNRPGRGPSAGPNSGPNSGRGLGAGQEHLANLVPPSIDLPNRVAGIVPAGQRDAHQIRDLPASTMPSRSAREAARRFVNYCVEVINGFRPVAHLRHLTDPRRFTGLADQVLRRTGRLHKGSEENQQVKVRRIRLGEPCAGVLEAAAVLDHNGRCWAMAFRMEHRDTGWQCTVVEVI